MIILRTGIPGHGKTLLTLAFVLSDYADREVYYHAIDDLRLPWIPLSDPERWYDVPNNAVVVIDEAQRVFPPRMPQAQVPEKCRALETHRHRGIELILITQQPRLIDVHVRRLVGLHVHANRPMGMDRAILFSWDRCIDDPHDHFAKKEATKKIVAYPKQLYNAYKSATQHTIKRKIPFRLLLIPFLIFFVAYSLYSIYGLGAKLTPVATKPSNSLSPSLSSVASSVTSATSPTTRSADNQPQLPVSARLKEHADNYLVAHTPAVSAVPWSAPIYSDVRKPVTYPKMICIKFKEECRCYSQQSTRLDVPSKLCHQVLEKGLFDYAKPDLSTSDARLAALDRRQSTPISSPAPTLSPSPISPAQP